MKLKRMIGTVMSAVMATAGLSGVLFTETVSAAQPYKSFDFTKSDDSVPIYSAESGSGFVAKTSAMPPRELNTTNIKHNSDGFYIAEDGSGTYISNKTSTDYNYGGLVFRVDVEEAGAYALSVELGNGSNKGNTSIAPSGMKAGGITSSAYWDSAKLVPIKNFAKWTSDTTWSYSYVTGEPYIEFEIEPSSLPKADSPKTVGVKSITIEKIPQNTKTEADLPTIYVLGDSTEKTYTFEEAGMSGWGQIIGSMFDPDKINVINYSMGGRSMKAMYIENRFNDVLMLAKPGDYIFIHSAHNDESTGENGPEIRFGRGSTTDYYKRWLNNIYIPAILSRGAIPVLVTPMPRTNNGVPTAGFNPDSPTLMKEAAAANDNVKLIDLYENAKAYINEVGPAQTNNIYMAIESGESPGKTNTGSYANGHPSGKIDGTHYKEAAAKVWCKIISEQIYKDAALAELKDTLKDGVKTACETKDWSGVFPEWTDDVTYAPSGDGTAENDPTYYRNQIEKLLQLGAMQKTGQNSFSPLENIKTNDFIASLCAVWGLDLDNADVKAVFEPYFESGTLIREEMASIILDAYVLRFGKEADGTYKKPKYMTDYNGTTVSPDDPTYDPNLNGNEAQYYPLVGWGNLTDKTDISLEYAKDMYDVYNLGLMRSETGIERGKMKNGTLIEPKKAVTRAKAAKELWFLWALGQDDVNAENQILQITKDGHTYSDVVYKAVEYTSPGYEFSSVNVDSTGKLSVSLLKAENAPAGTLTVKVFGTDGAEKETKTYTAANGSVEGLDVTLSTGEKAVLVVNGADGTPLSIERIVECTELIVPQRSYTVSNEAGIKNGVIGLRNLTADGAEAAAISVAMPIAESDDEAVEWKASKDVTKGEVLLDSSENGVCDLIATYDMTYTPTNFTIGENSLTGYVAHGVINGYVDPQRDRTGLLFTPKTDGVLTAYAHNVGSNKNFVIIENTAKNEEEALASSMKEGISKNCSITAAVKAGVTYYIGVLGSKGRFAGISFISGAPVVSVLAKAGETVEITATPNAGYKVSEIGAVSSDGTDIELTSNSTKTVSTFVMPEADVTVKAKFVADGSTPPTVGNPGDVDDDGIITSNDAAAAYILAEGGTAPTGSEWITERADIDKNGKITSEDADEILRKVLRASHKL